MATTLFHLLIVLIVLGALVYFAGIVPFPPPFEPARWVLFLILFIVACMVLLPFIGLHIPAAIMLSGLAMVRAVR